MSIIQEPWSILYVDGAGPRGDKGDKGDKGDQGDVGDVNPQMPIILAAAEAARDEAVSAANSAEQDANATAADRIATGADRVQTGIDAANADIDAATATTQAGIATSQAGIATTQAGVATTQAGIATTQSGISTTQAGIATAQAGIATTQADSATNSASAALASQTAANLSAGASAGSAAQALAIYGTTAAMQAAVTAAANSASVAGGHAASASSVVQQDLSGVNAAALHRSLNTVTAVVVYDTSKDSDGGAWTEKCQHTSWYNEPLNGKWLGARANETVARAVSGATTGDYYQNSSSGLFFSLNATSGITEVFRGNKRDFPRLAGIVAEAYALVIYDLTEPGRPMWMRFPTVITATPSLKMLLSGCSSVVAGNGRIVVASGVGNANGLTTIDFAGDRGRLRLQNAGYTWTGIATRAIAGGYQAIDPSVIGLPTNACRSVSTTYSPSAPMEALTGLAVPTIAVATDSGMSIIKNSGAVVNNTGMAAFTSVRITPTLVVGGRADGTFYWAANPESLNAAWTFNTRASIPDFNIGNTTGLIGNNRADFIRRSATVATVQKLRNHEIDPARGLAATITNTFTTGHQTGDIRRTYLADTGAGSATGTIANRSYQTATATITGTLTKSEVAAAAQLVAYSGFSGANYAQEAYSAQLDFGAGEWTVNAWVNIPTANAAAATIAAREAATGAYIRLGITAGNLLTATAFDGTTARTVTSTAAYNSARWLKARVNYTTDGTLALLVNGQQVAATRGNPLATMNNSNAVLTIGNSFALDAPFPGSIALLKLSATVPTAEQSQWMYEQEKHLFQASAQCCLPDAGAIADLTYDEATDKWVAISATNESEWSGLVRTSVTAVPVGTYTRAAAGGGVQLLARGTATIGVDVTIPAYGLREELVKRAEAAARLNAQTATYDFVGGFTANTTSGNTAILSIANLTYPTRIQGARVTGTGIPANASIADVSGTTGYLSAAATATGTAVQINLLDFALPTGLTATAVSVNGVAQREGPTAAYTRLFDGFREVIRFAVAPGNTAWVQIQTARSAT